MNVGVIHKTAIAIPGLEQPLVINHVTIQMMLISIGLVAGIAYLCTRKLTLRPGRSQAFLEMAVVDFYEMIEESLGPRAKTYFPLLLTIFLYTLVANWLGIIPGLLSPTEDLNACLAMALVVFCVAHGSGISKKGIKGYLKGYCHPSWVMFPINLIGELGQALSHCFRLFGNIFGGGIIFALVPFVTFKIISAFFGTPDISEATSFVQMSSDGLMTYTITAPIVAFLYVVCYGFFGLFAGTIQAFVFTILALTYITLQVQDDE